MPIIKEHFNALFLAPTHGVVVDFLDSLGGRANEDINADLIKPYTVYEVMEAIK